jgi:hypothetical protein
MGIIAEVKKANWIISKSLCNPFRYADGITTEVAT